MASSAPSTPAKQTPQAVPSTSPAGNWRHPRLDEINQRKNAATFNDQNVKSILWNLFFLILAVAVPGLLSSVRSIERLLSLLAPVSDYTLIAFRLLTLYNIGVACYPLYGKQDDFADIPLTPSQRQLLGLPPVSSYPATPDSQYITPPKFSRSTSASRGSSLSWSGSSLSRSSIGAGGSGTPFSPSASPLFHKALGKDATRRISYGSPSGLGLERSFNQSNLSLPPAPQSPKIRKGQSIELSNKYLYELGRSSSLGRF